MILSTAATANYTGFTVVPIQELMEIKQPDPNLWWGRKAPFPEPLDLSNLVRSATPPIPTKDMKFGRYLKTWYEGLNRLMLTAPITPVKGAGGEDPTIDFMVKHSETSMFSVGCLLANISSFHADSNLTAEEAALLKTAWDLAISKLRSHPSAVAIKSESSNEYKKLYSDITVLSANR